MNDATTNADALPLVTEKDVLTEVLRQGATQLLAQAIQAEVAAYLEARSDLRDEAGRHQVVRNGYLPQRTLLTGVGPVEVKQPRVQDRRPATQREKFSAAILPPYLQKTKSIEELIPWLYLKGVSSGDFSEALADLLGPQAKGLSPTTVTRLKAVWAEEYHAWSKRSLAGKHYVYLWADGVYFNIRLEEDRQCILVLMGATADGKKELIALADGYRESEESWKALLLDCQARGTARTGGWRPPLRWRSGTGRWASGRPCGSCSRRRGNSGAGRIRRPTCWTRWPKGSSPRPRPCCTTSGRRRRRRRPRRRSTCSWRPTRRSTPRRRTA